MATKQPKPPCEVCGGKNNLCYGPTVQNSDIKPDIAFVSVYSIQSDPFQQDITNLLANAGIDLNRMVYIPLIMCKGKVVQKAKTHCLKHFKCSINYYKPKVIITYGTQALKTLKGQPKGGETEYINHMQTYEQVHENEPHFAWHVHTHNVQTLIEHPSKNIETYRSLHKVNDALNGVYPKDPLKDKHYYTILNSGDVDSVIERYNNYEWCAFDIETGGTHPEYQFGIGLDPYSQYSHVLGASIAVAPGEAFYADFQLLGRDQTIKFLTWLKRFKLICQNGKFDINYILIKYGVDLFDSFKFDTMLADHLLREFDKQHGLKFLAGIYLPEFEKYEQPIDDYFGKKPKEKRDYGTIPKKLLYTYGCMDADVTLKLFYRLYNELHQEEIIDLLLDHVMRMQRCYTDMERSGWGIDFDKHTELKNEAQQESDRLRQVLETHTIWRQWILYQEATLRGKGKVFYDSTLQEVFTDSSKHECAPPFSIIDGKKHNHINKDRTPVQAWTYTEEDLIPNPTKDSVKRTFLYAPACLGLKPQKWTNDQQVTPSADSDAIQELCDTVKDENTKKFIESLMGLETQTKRLSTYLKPVFPFVDDKGKQKLGWLKDDGLIHPGYMLAGNDYGGGFDQGGTTTGRISSNKPNMTNQPTRKGGKKLKKQFIPAPKNIYGQRIEDNEKWLFVQADYSQMELRVLADRSGDPFMLNAYNNNEDLHTKLACEQNGLRVEDFDPILKNENHPDNETYFNLRLCAKTSWFSVIYGAGPMSLQATLRGYGLLVSLKECKEMIKNLESSVPYVAQLKRLIYASAPHCVNPFGRRRTVLDITSNSIGLRSHCERQLFNFLIQSTASDIASKGLYLTSEWLRDQRKGGIRAYQVGAVHDSQIIACPESELNFIAENTKRIMETPTLPWQFAVPIKVDVEYGPSWGDLHDWKSP